MSGPHADLTSEMIAAMDLNELNSGFYREICYFLGGKFNKTHAFEFQISEFYDQLRRRNALPENHFELGAAIDAMNEIYSLRVDHMVDLTKDLAELCLKYKASKVTH